MHYYKRHLGDYARKAGHLSMLEHGAYNLILDAYYDREQAPTRAEAIRYARARSPEEIAAVDAVLAEFFTEVDGRYLQGRVEQEFVEAAEQAEKNRKNGKAGGRPRKAGRNPVGTQTKPSGFPKETQTKGNPLIHKSTNPEQEQKQLARASRFPEFWNEYPVKKGKPQAEATWAKKGLDAIADRLIAHVRLMKAEDRDWLEGYAPHGSTYVSQERWHDEPKRRQTGPPQEPSKTLSAIQRIEGMKHGLAGNRTDDGIPKTPLLGFGPDPGLGSD